MGYRNLQECTADLERHGMLRRIDVPVDPRIEAGAIQRRVYAAKGPALLFTNPVACRFPLLGNLFGTLDRTRFIFRDTLDDIRRLVELKIDPSSLLSSPSSLFKAPLAALNLLPARVSAGPSTACRCRVSDLPPVVSWPKDGGAFITLPQVYTESPSRPGFRHSNLGMYRVQVSGNRYRADSQVGLHYQIHRGIGIHHAEALERGEALKVAVFVGGAPSMTVAAVMPLPEGMPEISFAGLLGGHRMRMCDATGHLPVPAEADFCIVGRVVPGAVLPEGPFGDHLGYYSLVHDFPYIEVDAVYHRPDAIWPFTTVGRPPQEDTSFGAFIHELTGPLIPSVLPGVREVHAVDAAGVHPLLLAVAAERYTPYAPERTPQELLTIANSILGQGQLSLAKYLLIAAGEDDRTLKTHNIPLFFSHVLERVDWRRDIHFQTATTMDTLDYSGDALNSGSKAVVAAAGPVRRKLAAEVPSGLQLPDGFGSPSLASPGILLLNAPPSSQERGSDDSLIHRLCEHLGHSENIDGIALIVLVDDSGFSSRTFDNFLWVTFTRSNPATDVYGVGSFRRGHHWGCAGPLVIDARIRPFHAPPLEADPETEKRVDALAAPGGPLHGLY